MECKECNLCCKLLPIDAVGSPAGKLCKHWDVDKHCKIYPKRPSDCSLFVCAYAQMKKASITMRPDRCGVIFEKVTDRIMLGTTENSKKLKKAVMGQIVSFNKEGISVIINSQKGKTYVYHTDDMTKEDIIKEVKAKWQARTIRQI